MLDQKSQTSWQQALGRASDDLPVNACRLPPFLLPLHGTFFGGVDLRLLDLNAFAEEESLDIIEQKVLCVRIGEIQTIVIDYLCLLLQPTAPARLADFGCNSFSQFVGSGANPSAGRFSPQCLHLIVSAIVVLLGSDYKR